MLYKILNHNYLLLGNLSHRAYLQPTKLIFYIIKVFKTIQTHQCKKKIQCPVCPQPQQSYPHLTSATTDFLSCPLPLGSLNLTN